ncbi:MAG: tRNA 2-thiouridine(34) synthase MnmA [Verrucomicrobiota bacterium]
MAKILVGMSGGVDSSVAAGLLCEQGHEVEGAYLKNWINEEKIAGHCPWEEDIEDARAAAAALGLPFQVVNMMQDYRERVVNYLLAGYESGVTPNPDVMCNREMKFGLFRQWALARGFEGVATGHYARLCRHQGGFEVRRGADPHKDQSYFLALVREEQFRDAWFPLGELHKPEVRAEAERLGLPNARKKDSQGICFIGEVRMSDFLRNYVPDRPGKIVTIQGQEVGEHPGLHLFTLGQRKGIRVPSNRDQMAYVVVGKNGQRNELVIGFDEPSTPGLYARECLLTGFSWAGPSLALGRHRLRAQPRYRNPAPEATLELEGDRGVLRYREPQRALTPGQICALYEGDRLLGGATFAEIR